MKSGGGSVTLMICARPATWLASLAGSPASPSIPLRRWANHGLVAHPLGSRWPPACAGWQRTSGGTLRHEVDAEPQGTAGRVARTSMRARSCRCGSTTTLLKCCTVSQAALSLTQNDLTGPLTTRRWPGVASGPPCIPGPRASVHGEGENWPKTIIIWSRPPGVPRMRAGGRHRGRRTIMKAPPAGEAQHVRKSRDPNVGEITAAQRPMKKTMARSMMLCRRPYLSETRPGGTVKSRPPIQPSSGGDLQAVGAVQQGRAPGDDTGVVPSRGWRPGDESERALRPERGLVDQLLDLLRRVVRLGAGDVDMKELLGSSAIVGGGERGAARWTEMARSAGHHRSAGRHHYPRRHAHNVATASSGGSGDVKAFSDRWTATPREYAALPPKVIIRGDEARSPPELNMAGDFSHHSPMTPPERLRALAASRPQQASARTR